MESDQIRYDAITSSSDTKGVTGKSDFKYLLPKTQFHVIVNEACNIGGRVYMSHKAQ